MGGISGGSSKSSSKPKLSEQQKATYRFLFADVVPMSRGQDTFGTRVGAQSARDEAAGAADLFGEQAQTQLGQAGGGSAQMGSLLKQMQEQALQSAFQNITSQKQQQQMQALQIMASLPLTPGQESKSSKISGGVSVGGGG